MRWSTLDHTFPMQLECLVGTCRHLERSTGQLSREYLGIYMARRTILYATKEYMEVTVVKYMYMALSTSTGLEIWIDGGQPTDMSSICSIEK
jgi:hypothetical protein